ncbi:hypothetical protein GCM10011399_06410 [Subtercola lobariae]|uniref:Uncharacterized protein n=2 Tax=Subtercola lobariae TaxID=1588641 RepID=A0A917B0K8_9MICO|nr:hypothetical protein GCM10011399_06410 [Subtercola lobariae]
MFRRQLGITALYNLVNDPTVASDPDVNQVRKLHRDIDVSMMQAYGWTDIALEHGFHVYRQMERFTVSPDARVEILDRLLEENHRRSALETGVGEKPTPSSELALDPGSTPEGAMF